MNVVRTLLVSAGLLGGAAGLWHLTAQHKTDPSRAPSQVVASGAPERTVGDVWLSPAVQFGSSGPTSANPGTPQGFNSATLREALRDVRIDDAGNVVADHLTLRALQNAFGSVELDAGSLARVQEIIRRGLPPPAGDQVATIVGNFHNYQLAAASLSRREGGGDIESMRAQLERLTALRHSYFGYETAEKLFGEEQASSSPSSR